MKKIALLLLLAAACSRHHMMSQSEYSAINLGTPIEKVQNDVGHPRNVRNLPDGQQEYEYIEHINVGGNMVMQYHYYLTVSEGRIVSKRYTQEKPPSYDLIYEDDPNNIAPLN
jgi:hypothetical protein